MIEQVAVKEKPILFSAEMVRAILEGRKTQTRRVVNHQPLCYAEARFTLIDGDWLLEKWPRCEREFNNFGRCERIRCPYGQPGDRLWVRETWASPEANLKLPGRVAYNADGLCGAYLGDGGGGLVFLNHGRILEADGYQQCFPPKGADTYGLKKFGGRWRPSIFMPRWASRLTLEITQVRVERLQEISTFDCLAEGIARDFSRTKFPDFDDAMAECKYYIGKYRELWDKINGKKHPWANNDWVWAISFKRPGGRDERD